MNETKQINEIPEQDTEFYGQGINPTPEDLEEARIDEEDLTSGMPTQLGGVYQLFENVLNKPDSTKVTNLNKEELGELPISVRQGKFLKLLANTFGQRGFAHFFGEMAGISSDTAMSKEGWFSELFVTSKKFADRKTTSDIKTPDTELKKSGWRMFSRK